jgi:hypothetical protein
MCRTPKEANHKLHWHKINKSIFDPGQISIIYVFEKSGKLYTYVRFNSNWFPFDAQIQVSPGKYKKQYWHKDIEYRGKRWERFVSPEDLKMYQLLI